MKIRLFTQSQSDERKLASDDSHWSASAKNFVLTGQWNFPGVLSGRNRLGRCSSHFVAG
ncbi:MAG TPA: hypothetical protein VIK59_09525 [Verrucomicrobiae bacterium]